MNFLKLYYLGKPSDGYGWGVANTNLVKSLGEFCEVVVDNSNQTRFDSPVFVPVVDNSLNPIRSVSAPRTVGYCFTEWPLTDKAERTARQYDVLFAGSTWNTAKLLNAGIKQADTLIQGVDLDRFKPQSPSARNGFVVFSGGKYEFRKGQDYVIAAMRHFMKWHGDAVLITAWHNPWPQSALSMKNSWLVNHESPMEGLPMDRVIQLPAMTNDKMAGIYGMAHIGVFPNRCEAGTNMVMAEFMACARPVIASYAHGQADILDNSQYLLKSGSYDPAGWFNTNVSDILNHLEKAYTDRADAVMRGNFNGKNMARFTWRDAALKIARAAFPGRDFQ